MLTIGEFVLTAAPDERIPPGIVALNGTQRGCCQVSQVRLAKISAFFHKKQQMQVYPWPVYLRQNSENCSLGRTTPSAQVHKQFC